MPEKHEGLKLSNNTKTSPVVDARKDGRASAYPRFKNSFGLPSFETCPGHTSFCHKYCYGVESEGRTNVDRNLRRNLEILRGKSEDDMYELISELLIEYQTMFDKKGLPEKENIFRIHWDGDFFSIEYAKAWYRAIAENPQIRFWVYTRSFGDPVDVVPIFMDEKLTNLAFYLSVDEGNVEDAQKQVEKYPRILRAYCSGTYAGSLALAETFGSKYITPCPENIGKMALAENGHGACVECMLCIKSRPNILFVDENMPEMVHVQHHLPFDDMHTVPVKLSSRRHNKKRNGFDTTLLG